MATGITLADFFEFLQQFLLPLGETDRGFQYDMAQQVAVAAGANTLDALAAQAEHLASLRFGRHLELGDAVQRGNFYFAAKCSGGEAQWHLAMQVVVVALEYRVGLQMYLDVEVAWRAAIDAVLALAGEPYPIAFVDP